MSLIKLAARGDTIAKALSALGRGENRYLRTMPGASASHDISTRLHMALRKIDPHNIVESSREFKGIKENVINRTMQDAKSATHGLNAVKKIEQFHGERFVEPIKHERFALQHQLMEGGYHPSASLGVNSKSWKHSSPSQMGVKWDDDQAKAYGFAKQLGKADVGGYQYIKPGV